MDPQTAEQAAEVFRGLLTDDEEQRLILHHLRSKPGGQASKEELFALGSWARRVRFENHALSLAIEGMAELVLNRDGDVAFRITEAGADRAKELIARLARERADANG